MSIAPIPDPRPPARTLELPAPAAAPPALLLPFVDPTTTTLTTDDTDPDAVRAALRLVRAVCDVAAGRRPPDQLTGWVLPAPRAAFLAWARGPGVRQPWLPRSMRAQQPSEDAIEVCARLTGSGRSSALALRLERRGGRWVCVAAELGPTPAPQSRRV